MMGTMSLSDCGLGLYCMQTTYVYIALYHCTCVLVDILQTVVGHEVGKLLDH